MGLAMACSNTFGLVTGAFLLGFGLSEIPKNVWRNADWTTRQKVLSHKIAKMAVELDDAHQELSNAIVVSGSYILSIKFMLYVFPICIGKQDFFFFNLMQANLYSVHRRSTKSCLGNSYVLCSSVVVILVFLTCSLFCLA